MTEAMFKEAVKNRTPIPIDVPLGDLKANMVVGGVAPLERGVVEAVNSSGQSRVG